MKLFLQRKEDFFKSLKSTENGLTSSEVEAKLQEFGKNELKEKDKTPLWELVLEQFQDQLVLILLAAAGVSLVLAFLEADQEDGVSAFVEPVVILLILIANAVVGVVQESNAEAAIDALKEYSPDFARVMRDGEWVVADAKTLVPGDLVSLNVGDKVPADCRVLKIASSSFKVDQAILTGESFSVEKDANAMIKDENAVLQDQLNMVFSGTSVTVGKALGMVAYTGEKTEIGRIHESISEVEAEKTPLKIALDDFGDQLSKIISVICLLVWLINIQHFNDPVHGGSWVNGSIYYFKIAVALAVAAIPEGLSVIITTCLALGTQKMAKQGAIVRKLQSVETLGCTSVICSDKTGTLTTNQMSVRKVLVIDEKNKFLEMDVEGNTYGLEGQVLVQSSPVAQASATYSMVSELGTIAACCNDAKIVYDEKLNQFNRIGEPTEAALLTLVEKLGSDQNTPLVSYQNEEQMKKASPAEKKSRNSAVSNYLNSLNSRLLLLEFSRDRKSMSVVVERSESTGRKTRSSTSSRSKKYLYCKGAPETVLERCKYYKTNADDKAIALTPALKDSILANVYAWGERDSLRVLAFAYVESPEIPAKVDAADFVNYESGMTFVGLVGMLDPPRPEVKDSILKCQNAGIRVIVITGDNKKTAESICRQIGVFGEKEELKGKSFTGREFDAMSDDEKLKAVLKASLFSRTEPTHKSELVDLLKQQGFIVAMTGDGVNDAPALKKADIGIAMGSGTDVAKLASDMVLQDDNFATIVSAVQEGRTIYSNTKQFIRYLISSNIGEVVSIFLTVVLGMPEALIPVQLLWVNLVTDGLPATALGFNPADADIMQQTPRNSKEPIVTPWLFFRYFVIGVYVGGATVFGYAWWFMFYSQGPQISFYQLSNFHSCPQKFAHIGCEMFTNEMAHKATTMSLSILVVVEMFNAMNSLSENQSLLKFTLLNNMYLIYAIILSMALHFMILYVPFFTTLFSITELNYDEWMAVLVISFPVILVDEVLKFVSRAYVQKQKLAAKKLE